MAEPTRDFYGQIVRMAWVEWAKTQPSPKPSWLVPWADLDEADKEADRCIGDAVVKATVSSDLERARAEVERLTRELGEHQLIAWQATVDRARALVEAEALRERLRLAEAVANEAAYPHKHWHQENLERAVMEWRALHGAAPQGPPCRE